MRMVRGLNFSTGKRHSVISSFLWRRVHSTSYGVLVMSRLRGQKDGAGDSSAQVSNVQGRAPTRSRMGWHGAPRVEDDELRAVELGRGRSSEVDEG
ncbi:hypothetical protein NDU88_001131 [Pleurodeles waltl]|uniref:Uncharacterized protein n=1 Tax=Pleurodeles waltl TaxID=8319 RepID=A0AAV7L8W7_PLEWA|nr:hypothetical protein NDU88_001131 [Pleurodeles waltl]